MTVTDAASAREYTAAWLAALRYPSPMLAARFMRDSKELRGCAHLVARNEPARAVAFREAADVLEAASSAALGITPKEEG